MHSKEKRLKNCFLLCYSVTIKYSIERERDREREREREKERERERERFFGLKFLVSPLNTMSGILSGDVMSEQSKI